jgi:hypothetical protein
MLISRVNDLYLRAVLLGLLALFSVEVGAMGLFDFMKVCLFSEVKGVVTLEGKPVVRAELVRTAKIGEKTHADRTTTDENGRFQFPAMYTHSVYKIAPVEPYIDQKIKILADGKEFLAWNVDKRNYDLDGELRHYDSGVQVNVKPNIRCELSTEERGKRFGARVLWGVCELD